MVQIHWKDRYSINFMDIDEQHKSLLAILNELIEMVDQRGNHEAVSDLFSRLCQYALTHFAAEEAYLAAANYPHLEQQKTEHGIFIQKLIDLDQSYNPADPALLQETHDFLKYWFVSHIMESDMDYVPALKRHGRASVLPAEPEPEPRDAPASSPASSAPPAESCG